MRNPNDFLSHFGMTPAHLQALVGEGLKNGGDWCDLFFEDTSYSELVLRDGEVSSGGSHIDYGCGVRVLRGEKTGYAYAESTEYGALLSAARGASAIAFAGSSVERNRLNFNTLPKTPLQAGPQRHLQQLPGNQADTLHGSFYSQERDWRESDAAQFVPALQKLESLIRAKDSSVHKVIAMLSSQVSEIMMYNSLGELTTDTRPIGSITVTVIFVREGHTEMNNASRSFRAGVEMITDALLEELATNVTTGMDERFEAKRPKGGKMPVVMAAGASGILLHEAMGHAFEADFNRKGQSIFADKMGKRVASRGINIIDDATIPGNRGAVNIDDEGVPGQKIYMVEDGILRSYLHDRISAAYYGVSPTGNGRRESFRYNPIPRMRCTYMESGADGTCGDLIASVKKGIFVDQFSNGEVKIGEGDFTFYVKSGRLIENGRLTMPVKDINIVGNGPRALADIVAVAGDLKIDDSTWTCGKEQSAFVSCGIPSVLVKSLTVGGE
ncbi:MAG: TldD/PmbA family protein [Bacteroidales bacterium]|nr:TldD/PmbA family protein [Bacteroidales bacterium]